MCEEIPRRGRLCAACGQQGGRETGAQKKTAQDTEVFLHSTKQRWGLCLLFCWFCFLAMDFSTRRKRLWGNCSARRSKQTQCPLCRHRSSFCCFADVVPISGNCYPILPSSMVLLFVLSRACSGFGANQTKAHFHSTRDVCHRTGSCPVSLLHKPPSDARPGQEGSSGFL